MERYHTRPPQPKMMTKRTLERLADPMKGRYESPPKEPKKSSKIAKNRIEKNFEFKEKIENRQPVRYHSPIRRDTPDESSCEESSPVRRIQKDSDSFFLTGTLHGEIEMRNHENEHVQSYHPVMDVRINVDKHQRPPIDDEDEVYTSRTKQYLQEAIQRCQNDDGRETKLGKSRKMKSSLDSTFVKEISSKKSKMKGKSEGLNRKEKGVVSGKKTRGSALPGLAGNKGNSRKESRETPQLPPKKSSGAQNSEKPTRWGNSRDSKVTKPVARKLLAPIAGIQTKKTTKKSQKLLPRADNLVGLERVDEGNESLLRTNSSSAAMRRNPLAKFASRNSNLLGSRSAPTLTRRSDGNGSNRLPQVEENVPAYRVHAPIPSRLLAKGPVSRRPPLPPGNKSGIQPSGLEAESLASAEPSSVNLPSLSSQSSNLTSKSLIRRSSGSSADSGSSVTSLSQSSKSRLSIGPNASDDQIAALFAQHAKKLSENLEKASNLSAKYQHMKAYDGLTASSRHIDTSSLLPKRSSNQSMNEEEKPKDGFLPPEKLSMII